MENFHGRLSFRHGVRPLPRLRLDLLVNDFVQKAIKDRYWCTSPTSCGPSSTSTISRAVPVRDRKQLPHDGAGVRCRLRDHELQQGVCLRAIKERVDFYLHYADVGQDADKRNYTVSYKKINTMGFQAGISLEEGIDELIRAMEVIDTHSPYSNV